jgi:5-methylcytosine-specific restriction endonuclease McrA
MFIPAVELLGMSLVVLMCWNLSTPVKAVNPYADLQADPEQVFVTPIPSALEEEELGDVERFEAGEIITRKTRASWAGAFRYARYKLLNDKPICEVCGRGPEVAGPMHAHHVISVKRIVDEGLDESLKWDVDNLIVLCPDCHNNFGHPGGTSKSNPNVREDAERNFFGCQNRPYFEAVAEWRENQPIAAELAKEPKSRAKRK